MIHADERRIIYDFAQGIFKSVKIVDVKKEIPLGDHLHNNKDEYFFLIRGKFSELQVGTKVLHDVYAPYQVNIPRGTYHRFICDKGSVLVCAATEEFDQNDEIK